MQLKPRLMRGPPSPPASRTVMMDPGGRKKPWDKGRVSGAPTAPPTRIPAKGISKAIKAKGKRGEEGAGVTGHTALPLFGLALPLLRRVCGPDQFHLSNRWRERRGPVWWAVGRVVRCVRRTLAPFPGSRPDPSRAKKKGWTVLPRPPKYAAVLLSPRLGAPMDAYAEAVRSARCTISLADFGIERPQAGS